MTLRCDYPTARRWFEMTVGPGPDGSVRFRSERTLEMSLRCPSLAGR